MSSPNINTVPVTVAGGLLMTSEEDGKPEGDWSIQLT